MMTAGYIGIKVHTVRLFAVKKCLVQGCLCLCLIMEGSNDFVRITE